MRSRSRILASVLGASATLISACDAPSPQLAAPASEDGSESVLTAAVADIVHTIEREWDDSNVPRSERILFLDVASVFDQYSVDDGYGPTAEALRTAFHRVTAAMDRVGEMSFRESEEDEVVHCEPLDRGFACNMGRGAVLVSADLHHVISAGGFMVSFSIRRQAPIPDHITYEHHQLTLEMVDGGWEVTAREVMRS